MSISSSTFKKELSLQIELAEDLEAKLDLLRLFKQEKQRAIQEEDLQNKTPLPEIFKKLSELADCILLEALHLAEENLSKAYGFPTFINNQGHLAQPDFAIIGMGKLGGQEIHYSSDLDLIFLYSRNGQTGGRGEISNQEYYARLVQKLISYLSVYTRYGFAYKIDTQLRASGNQGPLVSSIDSYAQYQRNLAAPWEKQALLKARVISEHSNFSKKLKEQFLKFIFSTEFPSHLNEEIHQMRLRIEKEIAKENERRLHYKLGFGGLADIEFAIQYLELKMGKIFPMIVIPNTLEAIKKMGEREILKKNEFEVFKEAYLFYRRLETRMETRFDLREGYLDPQSHLLENIAEAMKENSVSSLLKNFEENRNQVRKAYLKILQISMA